MGIETTDFVALLYSVVLPRGGRLRMEALRGLAHDIGLDSARTIAASGNLLFRAPHGPLDRLETDLETAFEKRFGKHVPIIVRSARDFARIPAQNPFGGRYEPRRIAVRVMREGYPDAVLETLRRYIDDEEVALTGGDLWIAFRSDPGNSRLLSALPRLKPAGTGTFRTLAMIDKIVSAAQQ